MAELFPGVEEVTSTELRGYAKEFVHYAIKMPNDPFARRWTLISLALSGWADQLDMEKEETPSPQKG